MNSNQLKGNWNIIKGKLKQQFAELTADDIIHKEGVKDELAGRLMVKLAKSKGKSILSREIENHRI